MTSAEQAGEPIRDFSSPATWGDVEQVRHSLETKIDTSVGDVKAQISDVQAQVAEVRTEMARLEMHFETRVAGLESRMETGIANLETRLLRWSAGLAAAAGVAVIGFLVGILQAVD
ncbi:MAG: hypothetical protein F4Z77_02390 [Dehalococcoidia bacterium]|nr:hypothetical protein [Dehalococcoidia bacterium]MXZ89540.1 hypothetical protein [Dehalococcoidia bacterium]MYA53730.1 hypothetical protein [Dehalococcoidia bacterium]MYH67548.1 hypothetical protein [Dehalococcoidia bacterium]MYI85263.1 hypothetical protein [Dehalococcoidia bacterium]